MEKNTHETVRLEKGEMNVYRFGDVRLHAYKTNDFIDNEVFLVEKEGQVVVIESPCFFDNNRELEAYIWRRGLKPAGMLLAYHMAGASFLPDVKKYATRNADEYGHTGGGRALIDQFATAFGSKFDSAIHTVTDYIEEGSVTIGGILFRITRTADAFDVEIPEINAVYTHMLGHDCHSIVAGAGHADALIAQLKRYLARNYTLILTSHYTPEDCKDAETKIAYLENVKAIAARSADAAAFRDEMKKQYAAYGGDNYLELTAGFFFA